MSVELMWDIILESDTVCGYFVKGRPSIKRDSPCFTIGTGKTRKEAIANMKKRYAEANKPQEIVVDVCGEEKHYSCEGEMLCDLFEGPPSDYYKV